MRCAAGRHYAWVVVGVTFCTLLVASGIRAAPGVLLLSLERDMGWSRAAIAFAVSIGLLLYGLAGPFAGRLMDRFGPRAVMLAGLLLMVGSQAAGAAISTLWQLNLLWGVLGGIGTGMAAQVLGATVANRWFVARRGLVLGFFGAAGSAGQLLFVPLLMALVVAIGWRASHLVLAGAVALVLIPVFFLMRDDPADLGLRPYGAPPPPPGSSRPGPRRRLAGGGGGHGPRRARPRVLAPVRELLRLRGHLQRADRDAPHPPLRRPRDLRGDRRPGPWP